MPCGCIRTPSLWLGNGGDAMTTIHVDGVRFDFMETVTGTVIVWRDAVVWARFDSMADAVDAVHVAMMDAANRARWERTAF